MMKEIRNTNQKEVIKQVINEKKDHLTADEVYRYVKEINPQIGRATVFRNLKFLAEQGEIGYVPVTDGADRYDFQKHNHYHFKCNQCHRVFDTNVPYNKNLDKEVTDYVVDRHVTLFYGICPTCMKKND